LDHLDGVGGPGGWGGVGGDPFMVVGAMLAIAQGERKVRPYGREFIPVQ
jgi:hypothetical protein